MSPGDTQRVTVRGPEHDDTTPEPTLDEALDMLEDAFDGMDDTEKSTMGRIGRLVTAARYVMAARAALATTAAPGENPRQPDEPCAQCEAEPNQCGTCGGGACVTCPDCHWDEAREDTLVGRATTADTDPPLTPTAERPLQVGDRVAVGQRGGHVGTVMGVGDLVAVHTDSGVFWGSFRPDQLYLVRASGDHPAEPERPTDEEETS